MGDFLNVDDFAHAFEEIHALLERARSYGFLMSQNEMKLAAETAIALEEMLRRDDLDSDAREALESWHSHTLGALAGGIDLKFFWMIGYYAQNLHNGEYPRQYGPMAALTAIRALEHAGEHLKPECTVRNNLEAGLEKLSYWADRCLPDHIGDTGLMWLLWGAVDTMATMNHHGGNAAKAWARITTQIEHHRDAIEDAHHGSAVLGYANSVLRRTKIDVAPFSGPFHETELSIAFNALESAARGDAIDIPEDYPSPPRSPLEWVVRAMKELVETGSIPVGQPFYNSKSAAADLLPIVWGWTKEVGKLPVTEADIEYAQGMNDPDIQAMLCEFFLNHEAVPADAMGSLEMERDKAHGGAEIADFATKINAAGTTYMVAMPVKSFAEAKGKSSAKLKEAYVYQFARPVLRYGWKHVVSYPIVLAEVTLNTQELATELDFKTRSNVVWISMHMFIKIMKNHNIWPIMDA